MKKQIWLLCFLITLSIGAIAADVNVNAEGAGENTLDKLYGNPGNLTDQEQDAANNFAHQGYRERKMKEACDEKNADCSTRAYDKGVLFDNGKLEEMIGKGYVLIFGGLSFIGGGGPSYKSTETAKNTDGTVIRENVTDASGKIQKGADGQPLTQEKKEEKDNTDYCMYAAMGWEMVSMLIQNDMQGNIQQETANIKDIQVRSLVALQKGHEARARTSLMQAVAYTAVFACYGVEMYMGGYSDWKMYAKMAGAGLISALYYVKWKKHLNAIEAVQAVIDSLPPAGDCNPYTGTQCFCSEITSKNMYPAEYHNVCVKKLRPTEIAGEVGCGAMVNGKMVFDKQCKCRGTKTCFTAKITNFTPNFKLGNNVLSTANEGFDLLNTGEPDPARLEKYSTDARAMALKSFPKNAKVPKVKLNPDQDKMAGEMSKFMPSDIAAIAAMAPSGGPPTGLGIGKTAGLDTLPESAKKKLAEVIKANYSSGGGGNGNFIPKDNSPGFQMPTFGQQAIEPDNRAEIVSFAEKAVNNADVSNSPDTPIFDIISNRYRRSGWNKVESPEMKAAQ